MSKSITFVVPARNRSGGLRVTMEMANRLIDIGYKVRIAYKRPRFLSKIQIKMLYNKAFSHNNDWLEEFKGKIESYINLNHLEFLHKEIVIAVGIYTIFDVYNLEKDVIKIRYNHGFSKNIDNLTTEAWSVEMPTITVSNTLIPRLESLSKEKVQAVIPNGINTNQYFVDENISRDGIGFMFSHHPNKSPHDLITLSKKINDIYPHIPQFSFGTSKNMHELHFVNYFRLPSINKAREIYNKSIIWLSTSCEEGLPGPILEALACGCVVISADNLGAKEIIKHMHNGILVPIGDIEGFIKAIDLILNNEILRNELLKNGKETVNYFSWENAVEKMCEFIENTT